jgi:lipopolysaccharide transport system ATP-binding protein
MAGDIVIKAEGLGKKYIIGHETERERYTALRDVVSRTARNLWKRAVDASRGHTILVGEITEEIWALKNVSFEVKRGEVLGIIGRNGAGKSTLLKVLSRITEPSEGRVTIAGRVASLLEVGTGFHLELTGRENIYLNGAVLGMSRSEIRRKLDEIVDFSGVEKFIDTPVKRYSSGMQLRLAFSVAAHLEPEIMIIDEVLAVGDAEFQKKCLGKIGDVVTLGGRTVLFVSHNLSAVGSLCKSGLLLDHGVLLCAGDVRKVVANYVQSNTDTVSRYSRNKPAESEATLMSGSAVYNVGQRPGPEILVSLSIQAQRDMAIGVGIRVKDNFGAPVGYIPIGEFNQNEVIKLSRGINVVEISVPARDFASGSYIFSVDLTLPNVMYYDRVEDCLAINIEGWSDARLKMLNQAWGWGSIVFPPSNVSHTPHVVLTDQVEVSF